MLMHAYGPSDTFTHLLVVIAITSVNNINRGKDTKKIASLHFVP